MLLMACLYIYSPRGVGVRPGKAFLAFLLLSHDCRMTRRACEASAGRITGAGTCANQQQSGRPRCSTDARVKLEPATGSRTAKINARARHYCGTSLPHRFLRCDASFAQLHSVTAYSLWQLNVALAARGVTAAH